MHPASLQIHEALNAHGFHAIVQKTKPKLYPTRHRSRVLTESLTQLDTPRPPNHPRWSCPHLLYMRIAAMYSIPG
jgi:hypothetical protein